MATRKWLRLVNSHMVTLVHVQQNETLWTIIGGSPLSKRFMGQDIMELTEWIKRGFGDTRIEETGGKDE